jgi:hypothetical protein
LSHYRDINQGVRKTPPPQYFSEEYSFSDSLPLKLPDTLTLDEVNQRKYGITSILNLIDTNRDNVQESYAQDLKSIDETIQNLEYGSR